MGEPGFPVSKRDLCVRLSHLILSRRCHFGQASILFFTHTVHWMLGLPTFYDKLSEFQFFSRLTIIVNSRAKHSLIPMF
jgi:hypothetical protein